MAERGQKKIARSGDANLGHQAAAFTIAQLKRATHGHGKLVSDGKAQASAAGFAVARFVQPDKWLQCGLQLVFGDAGAAVHHFDDHGVLIARNRNS